MGAAGVGAGGRNHGAEQGWARGPGAARQGAVEGGWPGRAAPAQGEPRVDGKHFQENFAALGSHQKAEAARGTGREEAARPCHCAVAEPSSPHPLPEATEPGRLRGQLGSPRPGWGTGAVPDTGKGAGSSGGLHQSPHAAAWSVGCRRGRRLETWHSTSPQSKGWGPDPTGKHILGTELPGPTPGSGPSTAHRLPHLLPERGEPAPSPCSVQRAAEGAQGVKLQPHTGRAPLPPSSQQPGIPGRAT